MLGSATWPAARGGALTTNGGNGANGGNGTDTAPRPAGPAPAARRLPSRRVLITSALVCALAGGGWAGWSWLTGDRLFQHPTTGVSGPVALGHTMYVGYGPFVAAGPDASERVDVRAAAPVVTGNSADADLQVLTCAHGHNFGAGGVVSNAAAYCETLAPFQPGQLTLGPTATTLVLAITPHQDGEVHVQGLRLDYRDGIRSGSQLVGVAHLVMHTP